MAYIRQKDLPNLKKYRYSGVDHSLISYYILKPFYTKFVIRCFPMGMAPNLITLSGFGFIIINVMTLLWYNPTLDQDCPPWVYASWAVGLFLYQTFDAVDGAQARRTQQSGPLGELFDHGVDAVNTSLGVLIFAASMNLGMGWLTVTSLFGSLSTFYVQTWDEYHTKTLTLGLINGPVEGVLLLIAIYIITAIKGGASLWQQSMLRTLGIQEHAFIPSFIYELAFNEINILQGSLVLFINIFQSSRNVIKARHLRGENARGALLGLLPLLITWMLITAYLRLNPEILYNHLVPFIIFVGLMNAYSVGQIITAHLAQMPFPYFNILVLPLAFGVYDSLGPILHNKFGMGWPSILETTSYQTSYCLCMVGFALGIYGSFVVDVIVTICDYLDIWCLTIKYPREKEPLAFISKKNT
ncbi:BgTH12-02333 [Blumeria graminis f. sp. triticale]|uniref:diacylglycerol cholinephosphotransferase n=1 Tax=Blumeria graminis f. sp. triticale TaxID=1689686 RepID=A0A9W4D192_BLUGR|nr:BgTH12-02333 [Blumeria graminis f. sp. triticale]